MENEKDTWHPFEIRDDDPNALEVAKMKIQIMESSNDYLNKVIKYREKQVFQLQVSLWIMIILQLLTIYIYKQ